MRFLRFRSAGLRSSWPGLVLDDPARRLRATMRPSRSDVTSYSVTKGESAVGYLFAAGAIKSVGPSCEDKGRGPSSLVSCCRAHSITEVDRAARLRYRFALFRRLGARRVLGPHRRPQRLAAVGRRYPAPRRGRLCDRVDYAADARPRTRLSPRLKAAGAPRSSRPTSPTRPRSRIYSRSDEGARTARWARRRCRRRRQLARVDDQDAAALTPLSRST